MRISELIDGLPVVVASGDAAAAVSTIVEDSRRVTPGSLFIARPGSRADGRAFIRDAIDRGAVAVLTDDAANLSPVPAAVLTAADVPAAGAMLAESFHGHPSRRLKLIGITGTNGKTTTAWLIRHVLNRAGERCGLIGTVEIDDGLRAVPAELTTPAATELSGLLRTMVDAGCRACVMEASSHALDQRRTAGLAFRVGVFTNLTGDHMDYHGSAEAYATAKARLFEALPPAPEGFAIVNIDDPAAARMTESCPAHLISSSLNDRQAACCAEIHGATIRGVEATFHGPWGGFEVALPLVGRHNVINALQAAAACWAVGLDASGIRHGFSCCTAPPGRLEPVCVPDDAFTILVDYAHTDDALENVLAGLRPLVPRGSRLRVVFGCGGDRDRSKRPRMARVACRLADSVIITSDNPRTEEPNAIIQDILAGVPLDRRSNDVEGMVDRKRAIEAAVARCETRDVLLIAGKGHEDYQIIGATRRPFDDRAVAAEAAANRRAKAGAA